MKKILVEKTLWRIIPLVTFGLLTLSIAAVPPVKRIAQVEEPREPKAAVPLPPNNAMPAVPRKPKADQREAGPPKPEGKINSLATPNNAVELALADVEALPEDERHYFRYVFNQRGHVESIKTTSYTVNCVSRGGMIVRPTVLANGVLIRLDLRHYAPQKADQAEWKRFWEELGFDPMFSLLVTRDVLANVKRHNPEAVLLAEVKPATFSKKKKAKALIKTEEESTKDREVEVVRFDPKNAIHQGNFTALQKYTGSVAPVVDHRYLKMRLLASIKDENIYKAVFGGLYYEFRGIKKARDVLGQDTRATDLDLFFENLGIGNIKAGLTADKVFDKLRSDQAVAMICSEITGKPRDVLGLPVLSTTESLPMGWITGDVNDKDIDIGDRAYANLLKPRRAAREGIFPGVTGMLMFVLFNGDGALQDQVPDTIARDHTIPRPHTNRLDIRGCAAGCHLTLGSSGWHPLTNDITKLRREVDIFGDRSKRKSRDPDVIDRLAAKYKGDFSRQLRRAQDDFALVIYSCTGPWKDGGDQTEVAKLTGERLTLEHRYYWWDLVTPKMALEDLGLDVPEDKAREEFKKIILPDALVFDGVDGSIIPEDPRLVPLRAGLGISRSDWALAYTFAADRAWKNPHFRQLRGE